MPRLKRTHKTVRLNLELNEKVHEQLLDLKDLTCADSMSEVIRRALAHYNFIISEQNAGNKILIQRGTKTTEITFPGLVRSQNGQ